MQASGQSSVNYNFDANSEDYNAIVQSHLEAVVTKLQLLQVEQEGVIRQQQEIIEAKERTIDYWQKAIEAKEEANRVHEKAVWELRNQVRALINSQEGGRLFLWKLKDIPTWKDYEQQESPEFNSAPDIHGHRYRLQATIYPQGVRTICGQEPTHAAIGWRVVAGEDDEFLEWPANLHIVVRVPLPSPPNGELRSFIVEKLAEPQHPAYGKPRGAVDRRGQRIIHQWITLLSVEACLTREGEMHVAISARPCIPTWRGLPGSS
jgi:hypothetical protein